MRDHMIARCVMIVGYEQTHVRSALVRQIDLLIMYSE